MISRLFLASAPVLAIASDAGPLETIKNVLLIAFLGIGCVWLLLEARRNLITDYGKAAPAPAPIPAPAATPVDAPRRSGGERPSPEVLAVLAAAVHSTLGGASRIVSISSDDEDAHTWAAEGRRAIYATRKVR